VYIFPQTRSERYVTHRHNSSLRTGSRLVLERASRVVNRYKFRSPYAFWGSKCSWLFSFGFWNLMTSGENDLYVYVKREKKLQPNDYIITAEIDIFEGLDPAHLQDSCHRRFATSWSHDHIGPITTKEHDAMNQSKLDWSTNTKPQNDWFLIYPILVPGATRCYLLFADYVTKRNGGWRREWF